MVAKIVAVGCNHAKLAEADPFLLLHCDAAAACDPKDVEEGATSFPAATPTSFSHGFLRFDALLCEPCPSSTVLGISLMPGIGWPVVMSSTMWAKDVGYGASGWPAGDDCTGAEVGAEVGAWEDAAAPGGGVCEGEGVAGRSAGESPFVAVVGTGDGDGAWAR